MPKRTVVLNKATVPLLIHLSGRRRSGKPIIDKFDASVAEALTTRIDPASLNQKSPLGSAHNKALNRVKPAAPAVAPASGAGHKTRLRVAGTLTRTLSMAAEARKLVPRIFD